MCHRAGSIVLFVSLAVPSLCIAQTNNFGSDTRQGQPSPPSSAIGGTVISAEGLPLHDIRIEVRATGTANVIATCYSNQSGGFEAKNIAPGNYDVVATSGLSETRERVDVQADTANVSLRMGRQVSASPKTGTVSVIELKTPEKARNLTAKANTSLRKNHVEEAKKDLQKALAIAPDYPDALTTRAAIELSESKMQAAEEDLYHAMKIDPEYGRAYLVLGAVFNQLGRYDEALRNLDRGSAYDPKSWQCALEASKAWMGKQEYQHAVDQLNRAEHLSAKRALAPIHLLRGYALIAQKRFEQARADFESYLTAEPNGQHAGSARAALARIRTFMVQAPDSLTLPTVSAVFPGAQQSD